MSTPHVYARRTEAAVTITVEWESGASTTKRTQRIYPYLVVVTDESIMGQPYVRVLQGTKHRNVALRTARNRENCTVLVNQADAPGWWLALPAGKVQS